MGVIDSSQFVQTVASYLEGFKSFAESFGKSRFLVYKSEVHAPAEKPKAMQKEDAEMEAIADAFKCDIKVENNSLSLYFYMDKRNNGGFLEIVDAGMPPPLAGGDHGTSHEPSGATYDTPTPRNMWDIPVEGYAKPATGVISEIKTMLASLFQGEVKIAVESAKKNIIPVVQQHINNKIKSLPAG